MAHRRKKIEKKRGTRTCGYGGKRKRRGKGFRGGTGYAGSFKHRKSWIMKYEPDHLGKRGFKPKNSKPLRVINLKDIESLTGDKTEIDLAEHGFDKVLGKGSLTKKLTIKAASFSRHAKEKIEQAGGKAVSE